jgi:hypothetical protein
MISSKLKRSILSMTGTFETSQKPPECFGVVTGNFDGQGLSAGVLQWNLGQGTLQPILKELKVSSTASANTISKAMESSAGILAQITAANIYFTKAEVLAKSLGIKTERGLALCFDICVQLGSLKSSHKIALKGWKIKNPNTEEWQLLKELANKAAGQAADKWENDVRTRKTAIATGKGTVHGMEIDLEKDFDISYNREWC